MAYDLIIQHNATKKEWVVSGLVNVSDSNLYLQFDDFSMPTDAPEGEYTYAVIFNGRDDVVYELKDELLKSVLHTGEGDVVLDRLQPITGLLKYGAVDTSIIHRKGANKDFYVRKK